MRGLRLSVVSLFLLIFAVSLSVCAGKSSAPASPSFLAHVPASPYLENDNPREQASGKTVIEYFRDEKIACGWNLGNTLDSHRDGYSGETMWGNPLVNQELMNGVKSAGFDIIRIPITWMGEIGYAPDYRITRSRLRRIGEIVEMARKAGLKAIINLHHDGSTLNGGKDLGWLSIGQASRNQEQFNRITAQYARLWQQIALYFKNYGSWLVFESFNELHDGNWQTVSDMRQIVTLNKWNQLFVDTVRLSGGNNETRYLMVSAYCNDHHQAVSTGFLMPVDTSPDRLILSFHYYDPSEFAINGTRYNWGTSSERQKVESDFAPMKEHFLDKNIQVVIGECGAALQLYPNDPTREATARQSRRDYISHVLKKKKKYGLVPIYWDNGSIRGNGEKFGLLDRSNGRPNSNESGGLITLMINAVK
jgi:endoglucanase